MILIEHMRILLVLLALAAPLVAQPPIPRYEVKRASGRIVIDGKPDEKAWEAAPVAELVFAWESQTGAKQKTAARLLWDDNFLYVSYDCEDAEITARYQERDEPVYLDDAVEIFVNPRPSQTGAYYGLEMNARARFTTTMWFTPPAFSSSASRCRACKSRHTSAAL